MKKVSISVCFLFLLRLTFATDAPDTTVQKSVTPVSEKSAPTVPSIINDWRFNPGDAIRITVTPDTGFPNGIYPVDGEGYVDLPMIGPLQVTSMSKVQFEEKLADAYIPLLRFSSIQVRRVISISFQGGFQRPGVYWVQPGATLWYALSLTGGIIREDGLKRVKWERNGKVMEQRGAELFSSPKPLIELGFQSGDVVRVINRAKRTGWDVFRQEILPMISFGLSTAITAITLYEWSQKR